MLVFHGFPPHDEKYYIALWLQDHPPPLALHLWQNNFVSQENIPETEQVQECGSFHPIWLERFKIKPFFNTFNYLNFIQRQPTLLHCSQDV